MSRVHKSRKKDGMDSLIAAVQQLEQAKKQAWALGIFTDGHELLECPNCDLLEDVAAEGLLVTYPNTSEEVNDSGLRVIPADCGDRGGLGGAGLLKAPRQTQP